ncbi:MAG: hypothetical protein H6598_10880 [Flavobacteriales bacterium]|nr:hypothetical protein [Flavobacteriales bacterium]
MKFKFALILLLYSALSFSQSNEVRRTIGFNFTPMGTSNDHQFYLSKYGLIYRQCFKSFVLHAELNRQWQGNKVNNYRSKPTYNTTDTSFVYNINYSYKNSSSLSFSLLKGWSNDISNLYLGAGINFGKLNASGSYLEKYYTGYSDSLGNTYTNQIHDKTYYEKFDPTYLQFGLSMTAAIEMRITERLSTIIKFTPQFNWIWLIDNGSESDHFSQLFNSNYKEMNSSGLELSLNYKL